MHMHNHNNINSSGNNKVDGYTNIQEYINRKGILSINM